MAPLSPLVPFFLLLLGVSSPPEAANGVPPRPREVVVLYSDRGPDLDAVLRAPDIVLRGASLRTDLRAGLPPVEGDRIQLQQVVLNLAVNGLDAMRDEPPGARQLTIRTSVDRTMVRVEVADTGRGIDEAIRDQLFEPFYTTKPTGMGMGLAICRSIVEAHGGSLSVSVNRGRGAVFQVTFPALVSDAVSA